VARLTPGGIKRQLDRWSERRMRRPKQGAWGDLWSLLAVVIVVLGVLLTIILS
jgi:hypothetical protein